jgi:hypothetical protein
MKVARATPLLVLFAILAGLALFADRASCASPTPPVGRSDCHDLDDVTYSTPRSEGLKKIDITSLSPDAEELAKLGTLAEKRSPQGTKWFVMREADFMHPGPWNSVLYVFGNRVHSVRLRISFRDHGNGGVFAQWLNEKLLFTEVW